MHTRQRIAAALAALSTVVLVATGCSKSTTDSGPLPDAAALLKESSQTTKGFQSVNLNLTVDGKISHFPVKSLAGDLTNTPQVAVKGKASVEMGGQGLDADIVVVDGTLYASFTPNQWESFGSASNIYDPSLILNPDTGLGNILANFTDPKSDSAETINDIQTVKVTGNVSADAVNKLIPAIATKDPVPGIAWIAKDGDHKLVRAQLTPTAGNTIKMDLTAWGKPVTVTKPPVR